MENFGFFLCQFYVSLVRSDYIFFSDFQVIFYDSDWNPTVDQQVRSFLYVIVSYLYLYLKMVR